ncbi:MAG: DUF4279 domain-containing protein [Campylobacteraceae bacterium]|nr:DUF4279 domain-containing protein [Campylobacteraceae bacterium]
MKKRTYYVEELTAQFVEKFNPITEKINNYTNSHNLDIGVVIAVEMYADEKPAFVFDKDFINQILFKF